MGHLPTKTRRQPSEPCLRMILTGRASASTSHGSIKAAIVEVVVITEEATTAQTTVTIVAVIKEVEAIVKTTSRNPMAPLIDNLAGTTVAT